MTHTSTEQPEALRLAEILEGDYCPDWFYEQGVDEVAAELRRQHTRIAELESELEAVGAGGVSGPLIGRASLQSPSFDAADMATAAAQGFRDGAASVSAGSEPVAVVGSDFTLYWAGTGPIAPIVEKHGIKVGSPLYTHPSPTSAEGVEHG